MFASGVRSGTMLESVGGSELNRVRPTMYSYESLPSRIHLGAPLES
jgi:hypothetical protein